MTLCMKCLWRSYCGLQSLIQVALLWLIYAVKTKSLQEQCALYLLLELRGIMHSFVRHQACEAWEKMVTWTRCIHVLIHNPTQFFFKSKKSMKHSGKKCTITPCSCPSTTTPMTCMTLNKPWNYEKHLGNRVNEYGNPIYRFIWVFGGGKYIWMK